MADYNAIADVGETLRDLLWNNIKDDSLVNSIIDSETQITLSSPEDLESETRLVDLTHDARHDLRIVLVEGVGDLQCLGTLIRRLHLSGQVVEAAHEEIDVPSLVRDLADAGGVVC